MGTQVEAQTSLSGVLNATLEPYIADGNCFSKSLRGCSTSRVRGLDAVQQKVEINISHNQAAALEIVAITGKKVYQR